MKLGHLLYFSRKVTADNDQRYRIVVVGITGEGRDLYYSTALNNRGVLGIAAPATTEKALGYNAVKDLKHIMLLQRPHRGCKPRPDINARTTAAQGKAPHPLDDTALQHQQREQARTRDTSIYFSIRISN